MKTLRPAKKWVLAAIVLLPALFVLKTVLFLTTKPKVTVDYMAEYNKISCPQNYDSNDNAAPYYQKAFNAFVHKPDELCKSLYTMHKSYTNWPTDFNDIERTLLEKWLISNTLAFEYIREAFNKPYYWIKRTSETDDYLTNNYMGGIRSPDIAQLLQLTEALVCDAKLQAIKGQFQLAFEDILGCYRAGGHKCCPNLLLMEQYVGLRIKRDAFHGALAILDRCEVESEALKFFQNALQAELDRDTYVPGVQAERLSRYDMLQRIFIDNGRETGRLWWRAGFGVVVPFVVERKSHERKIKLSCFTGPTRKQVAGQIEQTSALFDHVMTKAPWQIKDEGHDYFKEIEDINKRHISLEILGIGIHSNIFYNYHETKAQTEALITVLAVSRFKIDTGQFPRTLNDLVSSGYLKSVAKDPYSNEPLVYKPAEDDFKLYSAGEDFKDDGGAVELDIIYWPVQQEMEVEIETERQHYSGKNLLPKKLKNDLN